MEKIILVTGGARSGKSTFAEFYAQKLNSEVLYLATSQVFDEEMAHRVKLHKERRPSTWQTCEAPFDAHLALDKKLKPQGVVLFDCLTLYLSNYLCDPVNANLSIDELIAGFQQQMEKIITVIKNKEATIIFVTNEVGSGIVPENALARNYRDIAGLTNQMIAKLAQEVYYIVSGIPMRIKGDKA